MLPANILLRTLSPPVAIGGAVLVFGALVCGIGAAHNYATVLSLRILVGMSQAFIQGLLVYVSLWFKRNEVATVTCQSISIQLACQSLLTPHSARCVLLGRYTRRRLQWRDRVRDGEKPHQSQHGAGAVAMDVHH